MWNLKIKPFSNHKNFISTNKFTDKYLHYLILCGIIILTLIIYSGVFKNGFTNLDDDFQAVQNNYIKDITTGNIWKIFTIFWGGLYQPLTILSYAVDYKFFALNPIAYHSDNLSSPRPEGCKPPPSPRFVPEWSRYKCRRPPPRRHSCRRRSSPRRSA